MIGWRSVEEIVDFVSQSSIFARCENMHLEISVPNSKVLRELAWKLVEQAFFWVEIRSTMTFVARKEPSASGHLEITCNVRKDS